MINWYLTGEVSPTVSAQCSKCRELCSYGHMLRNDVYFPSKVFCQSCADEISIATRWQPLKHISGGHKFFQEVGTDRIAIADDSGETPDQTEDGVLFLDKSRLIEGSSDAVSLSMPLVNEQGNPSTTPISDKEARWVAENLGMGLSAIANRLIYRY